MDQSTAEAIEVIEKQMAEMSQKIAALETNAAGSGVAIDQLNARWSGAAEMINQIAFLLDKATK